MKTTLFIATLFAISGCAMTQQTSDRKAVTSTEAYEIIQKDANIVVLDVRTPEEFKSETGHLKDAILIPVQALANRVNELDPYKGKTIIAVCRSGNRSGAATSFLNGKGFNVLNLEGGMLKWIEARLPVVNER